MIDPDKYDLLKEFSARLIKKRKELKFSQEVLARMANCSTSQLVRIEYCEADPSYTLIVRLAKALKISPKELMN